eukprot:5695809-Amphidinium_carterae.1
MASSLSSPLWVFCVMEGSGYLKWDEDTTHKPKKHNRDQMLIVVLHVWPGPSSIAPDCPP